MEVTVVEVTVVEGHHDLQEDHQDPRMDLLVHQVMGGMGLQDLRALELQDHQALGPRDLQDHRDHRDHQEVDLRDLEVHLTLIFGTPLGGV